MSIRKRQRHPLWLLRLKLREHQRKLIRMRAAAHVLATFGQPKQPTLWRRMINYLAGPAL